MTLPIRFLKRIHYYKIYIFFVITNFSLPLHIVLIGYLKNNLKKTNKMYSKKYLKPSIVLIPLQIVGPNIGSLNDAEVQGDDYQDGMVWDDDSQSWKWPDP